MDKHEDLQERKDKIKKRKFWQKIEAWITSTETRKLECWIKAFPTSKGKEKSKKENIISFLLTWSRGGIAVFIFLPSVLKSTAWAWWWPSLPVIAGALLSGVKIMYVLFFLTLFMSSLSPLVCSVLRLQSEFWDWKMPLTFLYHCRLSLGHFYFIIPNLMNGMNISSCLLHNNP